jgi:rubrerythrin
MLPVTSVHDCLALAVEVERAGALFYARMANQFGDYAPLRELMMSLAEDEEEHEELFSSLLARVPAATADSLSEPQLRILAVHRFFVGPEAVIGAMEQAHSVHDVLRVSLAFERDVLQAYVSLRSVVSDNPDLYVLDRLIETEQMHVRRLEGFLR